MNGWANYETWNVALWIGNDEGLYHLARRSRTYQAFVDALKDVSSGERLADQTPDGVNWNDTNLDIEELDAMIAEL